MNTTTIHTNRFSFSRLWAYGRAVTLTQKKAVWLRFLLLVGFLVLYYAFHLLITTGQEDLHGARSATGIYTHIFILATISAGFRRYFSPRLASEALLLPVSKVEKFVYVLGVNCLLIPGALIACWFLNDAAWAAAYDLHSMWGLWMGMTESTAWIPFAGTVVLALLTYFFWGSVFFRKRQFLYTILLPWVVLGVLYFVARFAFRFLDVFSWDISVVIGSETGELWVWMFFALVTAGWIVWAWQRYRKLQIAK